jgi:hypothetical protein
MKRFVAFLLVLCALTMAVDSAQAFGRRGVSYYSGQSYYTPFYSNWYYPGTSVGYVQPRVVTSSYYYEPSTTYYTPSTTYYTPSTTYYMPSTTYYTPSTTYYYEPGYYRSYRYYTPYYSSPVVSYWTWR